MSSTISVRTQGVRGGRAKFETKGCVTVFCSDDRFGNKKLTIDSDSFEGYGSTYKERDKTVITISYENDTLFSGNINDLVKLLRNA